FKIGKRTGQIDSPPLVHPGGLLDLYQPWRLIRRTDAQLAHPVVAPPVEFAFQADGVQPARIKRKVPPAAHLTRTPQFDRLVNGLSSNRVFRRCVRPINHLASVFIELAIRKQGEHWILYRRGTTKARSHWLD